MKYLNQKDTAGYISWYCQNPDCKDLHKIDIYCIEGSIHSYSPEKYKIISRVDYDKAKSDFGALSNDEAELGVLLRDAMIFFNIANTGNNASHTDFQVSTRTAKYLLNLKCPATDILILDNRAELYSRIKKCLESIRAMDSAVGTSVTIDLADGVNATVTIIE